MGNQIRLEKWDNGAGLHVDGRSNRAGQSGKKRPLDDKKMTLTDSQVGSDRVQKK